jgi:hypothetical protein
VAGHHPPRRGLGPRTGTGFPACHRATPPAHAGRSSDARGRRASWRPRGSRVGLGVCAGSRPVLHVWETCLGRWRISPTRTTGGGHGEKGPRGVGALTAARPEGRDHGRALEQALAARAPHGWGLPDQRGGQPVKGWAEGWTADGGHVRGRRPRGPRMTGAGGTPRRGPPFAPRRQARPRVDRRQPGGPERRCGPGHTGDRPGGGGPSHVREWGRQRRARVLGASDAWPGAGAQAPMDRWLGRRGEQGAWGGRGNPRGVLGSKGAPLARDARDALRRRHGQHLRGRGTPAGAQAGRAGSGSASGTGALPCGAGAPGGERCVRPAPVTEATAPSGARCAA